MLCFFADPKIYIFPRSRSNVCKENPDTKNLDFITRLDEFKDSNIECPIQKKKFKEVETRIYADLAQEIDDNTVKISRYFSVGYLKKQSDNYSYFPDIQKHNHSLEVITKCTNSNINCALSWCNDRGQVISNENDNSIPICILPTGYKGTHSLQDILLTITFPKDLKINNQEIIIEVKKESSSNKTETLSFFLYKNEQDKISQFDYKKKSIEDFFVIPTQLTPTANQKKIIKELQKLNNQVLARNKKMDDTFCFLSETGEIDNDGKLVANIKNSIAAFRSSNDNFAEGCKSGNTIVGTETYGIVTHYPYNFSNFGQNEELLKYLSISYSLDIEILKGIIIDKNYLYGNCMDENNQSTIEGVKNLYDYIVVPFINTIIQHSEAYLNFSKKWLSCPEYNHLYHRGNFKTSDNTKKLYVSENDNTEYNLNDIEGYSGDTNTLPQNTIVEFEKGSDKYAFSTTAKRYKIKSVKLPGPFNSKKEISAWINLSQDEKKTCDDSKFNENYSNYIEIDSSVVKDLDKDALNNYKNKNGIPYYINGMDSSYNGQADKLTSDSLLNWTEDKKNWYSYDKKPNTKYFGIDCSGFVSNCIASFKYNDQISHFSNQGSYFQKMVSATTIKNNFCRQLPLTENASSNSFCQKGDILVSSNHIGFCPDVQPRSFPVQRKRSGCDCVFGALQSPLFPLLQA